MGFYSGMGYRWGGGRFRGGGEVRGRCLHPMGESDNCVDTTVVGIGSPLARRLDLDDLGGEICLLDWGDPQGAMCAGPSSVVPSHHSKPGERGPQTRRLEVSASPPPNQPPPLAEIQSFHSSRHMAPSAWGAGVWYYPTYLSAGPSVLFESTFC